jgi:hypothetical protein
MLVEVLLMDCCPTFALTHSLKTHPYLFSGVTTIFRCCRQTQTLRITFYIRSYSSKRALFLPLYWSNRPASRRCSQIELYVYIFTSSKCGGIESSDIRSYSTILSHHSRRLYSVQLVSHLGFNGHFLLFSYTEEVAGSPAQNAGQAPQRTRDKESCSAHKEAPLRGLCIQ